MGDYLRKRSEGAVPVQYSKRVKCKAWEWSVGKRTEGLAGTAPKRSVGGGAKRSEAGTS